jgi:hypothetical protein
MAGRRKGGRGAMGRGCYGRRGLSPCCSSLLSPDLRVEESRKEKREKRKERKRKGKKKWKKIAKSENFRGEK